MSNMQLLSCEQLTI